MKPAYKYKTDLSTTQPGKLLKSASSNLNVFRFRSLKNVNNSFMHKKAGRVITSVKCEAQWWQGT